MRSTLRGTTRAGLALAVLAFTAPALGQTTAAALFDEAKALMKEGAYERACPKIQEAHRLSPTPGTVLTLGDCLEHAGKLASSWGAFKDAEVAARAAKDIDREREAQRRAGLLAPKLARLAVVVPPAARVAGFELKRDGEKIGEGQWGSPLPVDIGAHTIETSAPGKKPWSTVVRIETNGSTASVEVPMMETVTVIAAAPEQRAAFWGTQRILGLSLTGAGLAGLITSAVYTAKMASKNAESRLYCRPTNPDICSAIGVDLREQAFSAAHIANGTVIAGGLLAATGLVVFLTTPRAQPHVAAASTAVRPVFGPGGAGIALEGVW